MSELPRGGTGAAHAEAGGPRPAPDRRQRRLLVGLALLFFAPVALSFYLYYSHDSWRPAGRVNAGELVDPPRPLPDLTLPLAATGSTDPAFLRRKWTFLYLTDGACAARCRATLYETRQVRTALNRDMDRVQRVFVAGGDCCDMQFLRDQHPDLVVVRASPAAAALTRVLPHAVEEGGTANTGRVYVIDPLGNLMMSYAPGAPAKGMLEDIKRLLRLSHIG